MSDSRADPRTLTNVQYYRPVVPASGDEKPGDVYALCALMMGVLGMMLKNKSAAALSSVLRAPPRAPVARLTPLLLSAHPPWLA